MPQLSQLAQVYASQFLWLGIALAFIFFVIARGMVPKIQATVDAREQRIAKDLEAAQAARATADQTEATIEQGTELPYQQATSSGATSVAFKKATLSLRVKPQITPDDNIIMDLNIHKDSVGVVTTAGPSIDTKQIVTNVLVQNGGTVVIGGIYQQVQNDQTTKVPVLGDLPYLGFLFKTNSKQDDRNELLIFISPKIMKNTVSLR